MDGGRAVANGGHEIGGDGPQLAIAMIKDCPRGPEGLVLRAPVLARDAVLTRRYTPGVVTAPTIVVPFSWWAWRGLQAAGIPANPISSATLALRPLSIASAHAGAILLLRARDCFHTQQAAAPVRAGGGTGSRRSAAD